MLPRIHLGTLLTVADTEINHHTKQQKQATLEARASRNMEGFHIYQTYLRRLRRMHRAYVSRYKKAHPGTKRVPPLPPPGTSQYHSIYGGSSVNSSEGGLAPLRHRLALSDSDSSLRTVTFQDPKPQPTPPSSPLTSRSSMSPDSNTIHIPCGREESFHELAKSKSVRFSIRDDNNNTTITKPAFPWKNRNYNPTNNNVDFIKHGALPFRLWRQQQNGSRTIYSSDTMNGRATEVTTTVPERNSRKDSRLLHPRPVGMPVKPTG